MYSQDTTIDQSKASSKFYIYVRCWPNNSLHLLAHCSEIKLVLNYTNHPEAYDICHFAIMDNCSDLLIEGIKFETLKANPYRLKIPKYDLAIKNSNGDEIYSLGLAWFFVNSIGERFIFCEYVTLHSTSVHNICEYTTLHNTNIYDTNIYDTSH